MTGGVHEHMRAWDPEEDNIIISSLEQLGPKWSRIVQRLPGRSVSSVRNRWQRIEKGRKLREAGHESKNRCQRCGMPKRGHVCEAKLKANVGFGGSLPDSPRCSVIWSSDGERSAPSSYPPSRLSSSLMASPPLSRQVSLNAGIADSAEAQLRGARITGGMLADGMLSTFAQQIEQRVSDLSPMPPRFDYAHGFMASLGGGSHITPLKPTSQPPPDLSGRLHREGDELGFEALAAAASQMAARDAAAREQKEHKEQGYVGSPLARITTPPHPVGLKTPSGLPARPDSELLHIKPVGSPPPQMSDAACQTCPEETSERGSPMVTNLMVTSPVATSCTQLSNSLKGTLPHEVNLSEAKEFISSPLSRGFCPRAGAAHALQTMQSERNLELVSVSCASDTSTDPDALPVPICA